ncbi:MAG: FixH family protein [Mariprofundaceae bacterium]|nr:FixH family protein [Mariprofundaceae bacterium]
MTNDTQSTTKKEASAWRSPWVRFCIGLLLTVVVVNVSFITISAITNPGLVTEEYYRYGMQQNRIDKMYRKQLARGWQVEMVIPASIEPGMAFDVKIKAMDREGAPISGARSELVAYRPSNAGQDTTIELRELSGGNYAASLNLPAIGIWDINLLFESEGEKHSLRQRIYVGSESDSKASRSTLDTIVNWLTD